MDQCTTVGPVLTNPIISLPPGGLSTWQPVDQYDKSEFGLFGVGHIWHDPKGGHLEQFGIDFADGVAPINMKDLACPTWGLGFSTSDDGTVITTIGPPYLPLVIPPMSVFSLNPTWASACTAMYTDPVGGTTLALVDPPIALTTAALLLPTPTAHPTRAEPTTVANQASPSPKPAKPASLPNDPVAPPARTGDPGKTGPTDPKAPVVPEPLPGEDPPAQRQGLGAIIWGAFGKSKPGADGSSPTPRPLQSIITVGAQIYTVNPTGFTINNVAITPGGTPYLVDNTIISLDQSGVLFIGSSTVPLLSSVSPTVLAVAGQTITTNLLATGGPAITASSIPHQSHTLSEVYTVADQTFTPNPTAFSIAGTTISADGPAATIDGTVISLRPSGTLIIGSSTIPLSTSSIPPDLNIDGFEIQTSSSFVVVDGVTLSAAAPGVTLSGMVVRLEPGGATLDIGTGRFALPRSTRAANGSINVQAFTGGQSTGLDLPMSLICAVWGALVLVLLI